MRFVLSAIGGILFAVTYAGETVRVSDFGYDAADATAIVQKALDSGAKTVIFDAAQGPWTVRPIFARGNTTIEFEEGVELLAKPGEFLPIRSALFNLLSVTNVTLRGLGPGAAIRMRYDDYFKPPYASAEWRHALNVLSSKNVTVENLTLADSGGDGIYLGVNRSGCPNEHIVIRRCVCDHNARQGISVISARRLLIEDTVMKNTRGKPPQAGIDFEPNSVDQVLEDCVVRNCLSENNKGNGYEFFLQKLKVRSLPVSVTVENCVASGNSSSVSFGVGGDRAADFVTGQVRFVNCRFLNASAAGIYMFSKPADSVHLQFDDCEIRGCKTGWMGADIQIRNMGLWQPYVGGIALNNLTIAQKDVRTPWFGYHEQSFSSVPASGYTGRVILTDAKGDNTRIVKLDDIWASENLPGLKKVMVRDLPFPEKAPEIDDFDECPRQMTDYPDLRTMQKTEYVFYAAKPGEVRIRARVIARSGNASEPGGDIQMEIQEFFGKYHAKTLSRAGNGEYVINVPQAGIYRLKAGVYRCFLHLEAANVPMALNVWGRLQMTQDVLDGFSVYLRPHGGRAFAVLSCGYGATDCHAVELFSPDGQPVAGSPYVHSWNALEVPPVNSMTGLWELKVAHVKGKSYGFNRFGMLGDAGFFFLDPKRTFSIRWDDTNRRPPQLPLRFSSAGGR